MTHRANHPPPNLPRPLIDGFWNTSRDITGSIAPWVKKFVKHIHRNPNCHKNTHKQPVFLIPGFMAGDYSLWPTRCALKHHGFPTKGSGVRWSNAFVNKRLFKKCEDAFLRYSDLRGQPISIIGQSIGGVMGLELAVRHTARVNHLITLGTPHNFKDRLVRDQPLLRRAFHAVNGAAMNKLGALGADTSFLDEITHDAASLNAIFNDHLKNTRVTSFFSPADTIVLPTQTYIPEGTLHKNIEMPNTYHMQMAVKPAAFGQILHALSVS